MTNDLRKMLMVVLCGVLALGAATCVSAQAQAPDAKPAEQSPAGAPPTAPGVAPPGHVRYQNAPVTNVTVDGNEAMFTTMCALLASGFEANVSSENWKPLRAQLRERMQEQQGPAVDAVREFYKKHELADSGTMLSQYIWFALVAGPSPKFALTLKRDELPPEVISLEGFNDLLSAYYQEQKIGKLWRSMQPAYNHEIDELHDSVSQIIFVATNYLRELSNPSNPRTFMIIVEPLVGRITNVRNSGDHYSIVLSGANDVPIDVVRHAYLHFLLDPLPLQYPHVIAAKRPLFDAAAHAPRLAVDLKDDPPSFFAECLVRAVELKLKRMSPGEREAVIAADDADGYILVRPLFAGLAGFEGSEPAMRLYFPDLVRKIDVAAEVKRVQTLTFAPSETAVQTADATAAEVVARQRKPRPTTIPNDSEAIAALSEGERRIAEKNPRAAEVSFQRVLAKYPDQPRAWYGLGLVALLDHDGIRAKEVFGRLTNGDHAATQDPLVLTWSHIYLARIYDDEGQREQAKTEYHAALDVTGGPEQAKQAAQKGLAAFSGEKSTERP